MTIDRIGQKATDAYLQKTQAAGERPVADEKEVRRSSQDEVVLSNKARELQSSLKAVQAAPDVREAKVEALKKQIAEGKYEVPVDVLANKMLNVFEGL